MHTPEQARELWCPMARVAQIGVIETQAAYNRSIQKTHRIVGMVKATAEDFELGEQPKTEPVAILDVSVEPSRASMCMADKCAMWRAEPESQGRRISVMCKQFDAQVEPERPAGMNPEFVFSPYEPGDADGACWIEPDHVWMARRRGFCGLAPLHQN